MRTLLLSLALASTASAQTILPANPPPPNNGGSTGWALFFDVTAGTGDITVTDLRSGSTAGAGGTFEVEVWTYVGIVLNGSASVGSGPGSDPSGWTSLGVATATQGPGGSADTSELIDIPDVFVPAGQTVGVALEFITGAGPRYFGTGGLPYQMFADANVTLTTGDSRSEPFTPNGTLFRSRGLVGELVYTLGAGGGIGTAYCMANANSTGAPAWIRATGSAIVSSNDVTLEAVGMPNNSFGFFLTSLAQGFVTNPGGSSGNLCLGGAIGRYVGPGEIQNSGAAGAISLAIDLTMVPSPLGFVSVTPGESRNFQAWHRDSTGTGTATSNFSNGVEVLFQ